MKKQTNDKYDKEEIIMGAIGKDALKLVRDIGFKQGYAKALADVEKIVDKIKGGKVICVGIGEFDKLISAFELKQEIAKLKSGDK